VWLGKKERKRNCSQRRRRSHWRVKKKNFIKKGSYDQKNKQKPQIIKAKSFGEKGVQED